jgi:hypothetical protein
LSNGQDDEPLPLVRSTRGVRAYNLPLDIEPDAGKVSEDGVESPAKVSCDVLKDRVPGS